VTTAIGNGIAIPHARIEGLEQVCFAFGITPDGSYFESIDGKPANIFFLTLFPAKEVTTQVCLLERLSRFLNDKKLRKKLSTCKTG
jgi:nitrogen PTS system EIIA component